MKFTVKASGMPSIGLHSARVSTVTQTTSKSDLKTPQIEVVFLPTSSDEHWIITKWYNLRGYEHSESSKRDDKVVMKNNKPVESEDNTAICLDILGKHAYRMGLTVGESDINDLVGCECGIQVEPKDSDPTKVEVSSVVSSEKLVELIS